MRLKKIIRLVGAIVLAASLVVGGVLLNAYLKTDNRFIYATGTRDKAFLKATWKMSPREVQRANQTTLVEESEAISRIFGPDVLDKSRLTEYIQSNISLWGWDAKVHYEFFDNMLYEYYIGLD